MPTTAPPESWSPVDWACGAAVPDPARVRYGSPEEPRVRTERLLRQALARYSLSWRQAHGEQFVTSELAALGAAGFEGTRLPGSVSNELARQASGRERSRQGAARGLLWWTLTGRGGRRLDRWVVRDALLDGTWAMSSSRDAALAAVCFAVPVGVVLVMSGRQTLAPLTTSGSVLASYAAVMGFEWTAAFRRLRQRRLRQLGFTEAGVPLEWLPAPPPT